MYVCWQYKIGQYYATELAYLRQTESVRSQLRLRRILHAWEVAAGYIQIYLTSLLFLMLPSLKFIPQTRKTHLLAIVNCFALHVSYWLHSVESTASGEFLDTLFNFVPHLYTGWCLLLRRTIVAKNFTRHRSFDVSGRSKFFKSCFNDSNANNTRERELEK